MRLRWAILCLALSGCSTRIDLESVAAPEFNLTGRWQLVAERSDVVPAPGRERVELDRNRFRRPVLGGSAFAFIAQDFPVVAAQALQIEQNSDSMGVNYTPGGYADISWGYRERGVWEVNAGWNDDGNLLVLYKAHDMRASETYQLAAPDELVITVGVRADSDTIELRRIFRRIKQ